MSTLLFALDSLDGTWPVLYIDGDVTHSLPELDFYCSSLLSSYISASFLPLPLFKFMLLALLCQHGHHTP